MPVHVTQNTIIVSVAAVAVTAAILWWRHKQQRHKIPSSWKKVGEISELWLFPLKSGRGIQLEEAQCSELGFRSTDDCSKELRNLRDRFFVVYNSDKNHFITCRNYPPLMQVTTSSAGEGVVQFGAPEVPPITVKLPDPSSTPKMKVTLWKGEQFDTIDCGDEAAQWISNYLNKEPTLRIGCYVPGLDRRNAAKPPWRSMKQYYKNMRSYDTGVYTDMATLMLMCQSSLDDLNSRIPPHLQKIPAKQFRPNLVITGTQPYEEDTWDWIKIGDNVVIRNYKPCTRCIMTTMDPETGIKEPQMEPLKTLKQYRQVTEPAQRKLEGESPCMGLYLGLHAEGTVKIGDSVYVGLS